MAMAQVTKKHNYKELSAPEKRWVVCHLFVAKRASKISSHVINETSIMGLKEGLDEFESGGKKDAFRHVYWMAILSSRLGANRARSLGNAHELGNKLDFEKKVLEFGEFSDLTSMEMDLWNNEVGIQIGKQNKKAAYDKLKKLALKKVRDGDCKIIKRNNQGLYLDKNDRIIKETDIKGKWLNDKCLIPSNK